MAIKILSSTFNGIDGIMINVEIDISKGLPCFSVVGLADTSVKESKERVRSAIINSGFEFPVTRITVNLAPADIRKEGSHFDLPIAIGILAAVGQIDYDSVKEYLFVGELSLGGEINRVRGILPIIIEGSKRGIKKFVVPSANIGECSIIKDVSIYPFETLGQIIHYLKYKDSLPVASDCMKENRSINYSVDFSDVIGQESCKRAIEIAAAGGHNLILFGPPGAGKTMLAQRLPTILPDMSYDEALDVTKIYSVSGNLQNTDGLVIERPFRSPHHTISRLALIGGGNSLSPGEISLAHHGVLYLDEILEFKKNVLEVLRQPLEDRYINVTRVAGNARYPANFMLVGSMNPCPCGYYGSDAKECLCTEYERRRYLSKLSGPLLDRIDIFIQAAAQSYKHLSSDNVGESSNDIRERVRRARERQKDRFCRDDIYCNSQMNSKLIKQYCKLDANCIRTIEYAFDKYKLSTRGYSRILKLSRTIADLSGREHIMNSDIIEALQYREFLNAKDA